MPPRPKAIVLPLALARRAFDQVPNAPTGRYGDASSRQQILDAIEAIGEAIDRGGEYVSPLWPPPGHPDAAHRAGCGLDGRGCTCVEKKPEAPVGRGQLRLLTGGRGR